VSYFRQVGTAPERWYPGGTVSVGVYFGSATFAKDTLFAIPFIAPRAGTLDRIGVKCTSVVGNVRLGIYSATSSTDLRPSALVVDAGAVACSAAVLTKTIAQALTAGTLYWLAIVADTVNTALGTLLTNLSCPIFGLDNTLASQSWSVTGVHVYAALPNPFPTVTLSTTNPPLLAVRFSA
jgi:hypothetical protein